jgi:hypothetical protein
MIRIIKYLLILLVVSSFTFSSTNVFICDSAKAVAYHSKKQCSGLGKCTHDILEISENDAIKKYDRRKCKVCF